MSRPAWTSENGEDARVRRLIAFGVWTLACVGLYAGWKAYWFLTDDAFIAFRYVSQRRLGFGYVWNAPPFLPVEGYSSLLWLWVLDAVWSTLGVEPPESANALALLCAIGSLTIVTAWVIGRWRDVAAGARLYGLLAVVLLFTVSNRSFLMWASSGLETAMFNLLVLAWVFVAFGLERRTERYAPLLAVLAVLLELARPDGLLFYALTVALLGLVAWRRMLSRRAALFCAVALLGVPAHLLWRKARYGEWLPNTYYAKIVEAWPEAGVRYFAAFVLEYGLWFWAAVVAVAALRAARALPALSRIPPLPLLARGAALAALVLHAGYYVLVVGGDHFEFRVFSHLVPLLSLAFAWSLLWVRKTTAAVACGVWLVLANAIPWTHFALTRDLETRAQTRSLLVAVAPALPPPLAQLAGPFDALQAWLIPHGVGTRHKEHDVYQRMQASIFPSRDAGLAIRFRQPRPVLAYCCVGVLGWTLPHVSVIDTFGLNDYVVARSPAKHGAPRYMAHDRAPPPGYVESLMPNLALDRNRRLVELQRPEPLTPERIRAVEQRYRALVARR